MLKVNGLSLEEVARATSSSVGAVKQKAHRGYERLRAMLQTARDTEALHKASHTGAAVHQGAALRKGAASRKGAAT